MPCSVIEHGMTSLSFQTTVQNNEAKLGVDQSQLRRTLTLNNARLPMFNCLLKHRKACVVQFLSTV